MDIFSIIILLLLGPVLIKFIDRSYLSLKDSQIYKDLSEFDTEPDKKISSK